MFICNNCGKPLNDGASFCDNCGAPVGNMNQQQPPPEQKPMGKQCPNCRNIIDARAKKCPYCGKNFGIGCLGAIGIAILVIVLLGILIPFLTGFFSYRAKASKPRVTPAPIVTSTYATRDIE